MFIVISYDVVSDKRRTKVLKLLKGYGTHVQYSVFECELDPAQLQALRRRLRELIDLHSDSVRFYFLNALAVEQIQVLGIGQVSTDPAYHLVGG